MLPICTLFMIMLVLALILFTSWLLEDTYKEYRRRMNARRHAWISLVKTGNSMPGASAT